MKLHAEMWDKMQDIMAKYNDHMVHFYIKFDGILYKQILKKALAIAIDNIPVLNRATVPVSFGRIGK